MGALLTGMPTQFGGYGKVRHEVGKELSNRELAELKQAKAREELALDSILQARELLNQVEPDKDFHQNVKLCDDAIDRLCYAILYDEGANSAFFWRAEAYRIRALCRRN